MSERACHSRSFANSCSRFCELSASLHFHHEHVVMTAYRKEVPQPGINYLVWLSSLNRIPRIAKLLGELKPCFGLLCSTGDKKPAVFLVI
jgi:hypothetical protein